MAIESRFNLKHFHSKTNSRYGSTEELRFFESWKPGPPKFIKGKFGPSK